MQQIKIDFDNPGLPQHLEAMEGDAQSRFFQATLYRSGAAYTPPAGVAYSIMYRGFGEQNQGWYDTIEDDTGKRDACVASGNVVTCEIDRHALIVPGHVSIVLCITNDRGYMLKGRPILTDARNDNYDDTVEVESYFRITGKTSAWWLQNKKDVQDLVDKATAEATKAENSANASANSAAASKKSADDSAASASASADSAAAAARSERAAAGSATEAAGSASAAEEFKTAAATSEANAAKHEEAAKKAADEAGAKAGTDKTLSIENAPADAAVVGGYILDQTKDTPELVFYSKDETDAKIKEMLDRQREEDFARIKFWVSNDPTSPAELFGGTWERIEGRFIMGASDTYPAGSTGGSAEHYHNVGFRYLVGTNAVIGGSNDYSIVAIDMASGSSNPAGPAVKDTEYNANLYGPESLKLVQLSMYRSYGTTTREESLPPYYSIYIWQRIA